MIGHHYLKLGDVSNELERLKETLSYLQKSLEITLRLAVADSKNNQTQRDLSICYERLGDALFKLGQNKEAFESYQKYHEICKRLAEIDEKNTQGLRDWCISHGKLALVHKQLRDYEKAIEVLKKAEKIAVGYSKPGYFERDLQVVRLEIESCHTLCK